MPDIYGTRAKDEVCNINFGWDLIPKNIDLNNETSSLIFNDKYANLKGVTKLSNDEKIMCKQVIDYLKDISIKETNIKKILANFCHLKNIILKREQYEYLLEVLNNEIYDLGPLTKILSDSQIEEITIVEIHKPIYVYINNHGWKKTNLYFDDEEYLREMINRFAREQGKRITLNEPILDTMIHKNSRLNAIIEPISKNISITIRKFKQNPITPINLVEYNTLSLEMLAFLWMVMKTDSNIVISGNTGSGKTTTLNSIFCFVDNDERIIITEETPEIKIPHEHKVNLKVNLNRNIEMKDLIKATLRMRPDRLIVGEIRDSYELDAYINTILAGQGKGSYATFHGQSSYETIKRMIKLGVLEQDLESIDIIINQRRWNKYENGIKKEVRKIVSICEYDGKINEIFKYDYKQDNWQFSTPKKIKEKVEISFGEDYDLVFNKFKNRVKELKCENLNFEELFVRVNDINK